MRNGNSYGTRRGDGRSTPHDAAGLTWSTQWAIISGPGENTNLGEGRSEQHSPVCTAGASIRSDLYSRARASESQWTLLSTRYSQVPIDQTGDIPWAGVAIDIREGESPKVPPIARPVRESGPTWAVARRGRPCVLPQLLYLARPSRKKQTENCRLAHFFLRARPEVPEPWRGQFLCASPGEAPAPRSADQVVTSWRRRSVGE